MKVVIQWGGKTYEYDSIEAAERAGSKVEDAYAIEASTGSSGPGTKGQSTSDTGQDTPQVRGKTR